MSKTWDDAGILYKETEQETVIRAEQETEAKNRKEVFGAHMSFPTGKSRKVFKSSTKVMVPRVKKIKIDTSSKAWKDYQDKKISFSEMKKMLGIKGE